METTFDNAALLAATRRMHEEIRARVGALLEQARRSGKPELAHRPGAWQAGDLVYALDEVAEDALSAFGETVGASHPLTLVAEGPGVLRFGEGAGGRPLRAIIDPVDGTRSLMHDMRSAWALTGIAPDKGEATRLSDVEVAVQTELPTTSAGIYHVLTAVRGQGASIARHDVASGEELESCPLVVGDDDAIDNGYLCFASFLPVERRMVAEIEERFLTRAIEAEGLTPRLLYDDQYLCNAGQMFFVTTGRYRMLADLRGWLHGTRGIENFTGKPYDMAALLIYREAGVPVLDAAFAPLDAPLDTSTRLSILAFGNEALRARLEPHLRAAMGSAG